VIINKTTLKCELYDISGNKVKQLLNEVIMAGNYETKIDLSDLSKGIFFLSLKTSNGVQTKKMIKL